MFTQAMKRMKEMYGLTENKDKLNARLLYNKVPLMGST